MKRFLQVFAFLVLDLFSITWGVPAMAQDFVRQQISTVNYTTPLYQQRYNAQLFNPPLLFDIGGTAGTQNIFQVVPLTTANTVTFNVAAPAQATSYKFTDPGGATGTVPFLEAAQTFSAANTFSATQTFSPTTNQLKFGAAGHLVTYSVTAPAAAAQTYTTPDAGANANYMLAVSAVSCGTTTTCAATATPGLKIAFGSVALTSATPSTAVVSSIPAFTGTTSFTCVATEATNQANNTLKVVNTSTTSITITGAATNTDTISYFCWGT